MSSGWSFRKTNDLIRKLIKKNRESGRGSKVWVRFWVVKRNGGKKRATNPNGHLISLQQFHFHTLKTFGATQNSCLLLSFHFLFFSFDENGVWAIW